LNVVTGSCEDALIGIAGDANYCISESIKYRLEDIIWLSNDYCISNQGTIKRISPESSIVSLNELALRCEE